jgi:tRNA dimethylallyltransferase
LAGLGSAVRLLVVCGPTATGKTRLAIMLARHFGGELVGADSMQVYAGLPVGTAAPTEAELDGLPCHLCGTVSPQRLYSVADWLVGANAAIADIAARGALPVVCGGTGLYISSLLRGTGFLPEPPDHELTAALQADWRRQGGAAMLRRLAAGDPERAAQLHPNDKKRILRALEQLERTGFTAGQREVAQNAAGPGYHALCLGLNCSDRAVLYARVNARVDGMLAQGLLNEARAIWRQRECCRTAAQAIGYKEFFPYFAGEAPLECCVDKLKQATRNYAKRQITWFDKLPGIRWLDAEAPALYDESSRMAGLFLDKESVSAGFGLARCAHTAAYPLRQG